MSETKKLSALIRAGSAKTRKARGALAIFHGSFLEAACALGAAYAECRNMYITPSPAARQFCETDVIEKLKDVTGVAAATPVYHPGTGVAVDVYSAIISLNDQYAWSREKIADWLEGLGY